MASIRFDIITIGTLARNRLWNESSAVRTAHATTTLVRTGDEHILVDPGLPSLALGARLFERTGLHPGQITTVFLTSFRDAHRAGLSLFPNARVLIHEVERQAARQRAEQLLAEAPEDDLDREQLQEDLKLLDAMQTAEDAVAPQIDLFPLFGPTAGNCGLLLSMPTITVLIAGEAVATQDHYLAGQVLPDAYDLEAAKGSLQEVYEIADLIVPAYDNVFMNPRSYGL